MGSDSGKFTVHVVSHTHWDREWYLPFAGFRRKLVQAIDSVLNILARDSGYIFHLDGQVILLEDYLEARPRNEARIKQYIREGRLVIGPWYVMPDEFLVSPESLYRNLKIGMKRGASFGPVMKVGYLPDTFGHVSQLAQLLTRFGIESAVVQRGMPGTPEDIRSEIWLGSPDGSRVLTAYLVHGYTNARALGSPDGPGGLCRKLLSLLEGPAFSGGHSNGLRDWLYNLGLYPATFRIIHLLARIEDCALREGLINREAGALRAFTNSRHILLLNGGDHYSPQDNVSSVIKRTNAEDGIYYLKQDTLENYFRELSDKDSSLPVVSGELRSTRFSPLLTGVLSARMNIKQKNHRLEDLLERWAYPWAAIAAITCGKEYPHETLEQASRLLIQNHAHDTICGTSISDVYQDVERRMKRSEELAKRITQESLDAISARVTGAVPGSSLLVFNPLPWGRSEVVSIEGVAGEYNQVLDCRGNASPAQLSGNKLFFRAENLPPLGYRLFRLATGTALSPSRNIGAGNTLENEHLTIKVLTDGSFTVNHKASGRAFGPLGYFEDGGDAGDTYNYAAPEYDKKVNSLNAPAEVSLVSNGPLEATIRVRLKLLLPAKLDMWARKRVSRKAPLEITSFISLKAGSPLVNISTSVDNRVRDHRIRVIFPTGIGTEMCWTDGHWDVIERAVRAEPELDRKQLTASGRHFGPAAGVESPSLTQPQRRFVDINDGKLGLAIINNGLPEYEAGPDGTIALTLLRCVGWLSRSFVSTRHSFAGPVRRVDDAQCWGKHSFEYAVMPHAGNWEQAQVYIEAEKQNIPCIVRTVTPGEGTLPPEYSLVSVSAPELVISGVELSEENRLLIRLYNVSNANVRGEITFGFQAAQASLIDFTDKIMGELALKSNRASLEVKPKEVVMLSIRMD